MLEKDSILKEEGAAEILQQAMEDGSSVVCCECDALVMRDRWEPHKTMWCPMLTDDDEDSGLEDLPKDELPPKKSPPKQQKKYLEDELD